MVFNPVDINREAPPEYGIDAQHVNVIKIDLTTARTRKPLHIGGVALAVVDASSDYANFELFWKETQNDGYPMRHASVIRGVKFSRPLISHTAQAGSWVKIAYIAEKDAAQFVDFDITKVTPVNFVGGTWINTTVNYPHTQLVNGTTNRLMVTSVKTFMPTGGGKDFQFYRTIPAVSAAQRDVFDENGVAIDATNQYADLATNPSVAYTSIIRGRSVTNLIKNFEVNQLLDVGDVLTVASGSTAEQIDADFYGYIL